jgi:D-arabinose 1-dehydrogenase-like Zn-dependent alcohol dehydrogenase
MCSAATSYSSIKASGLQPGQWAVFPGGGGGVGIQGVQLASAMGLRPIVVDTGKDRRKLAMSLGAEHFIDFRETDPVKSVIDITAGGAHGVFVTGKSWKSSHECKDRQDFAAVQSYPICLEYLGVRPGGQIMW